MRRRPGGGPRGGSAILRLIATWADQVRHFPLAGGGELHLGSAGDNDMVVPAPGVSRRHARLRSDDDGLTIFDLGSTNGIVQENRRHDRLRLRPGGPAVFLGRAALRLEEVPTDEVELALHLEPVLRGVQEIEASRRTDALRLEADSPDAGRALRFVRRVEELDGEALAAQRGELLHRARRLLGGTALLHLGRDEGDGAALLECDGALPDDAILARLAALEAPAAGKEGPRVGKALLEGEVFVLQARADEEGTETLALVRKGRPTGENRWQKDFLLYLVSKFFRRARHSPAPAPPAAGGLQFPEGFVQGGSAAFQGLLREIEETVKSDLDVLLSGETGTGKELLARTIHLSGPTPEGPFVAINCAAIPGELLEAELFGVEKGVATGVDPRPGRFLQADGGTLFLDEVGELDERLQAKLLRVLQEREVLPLGGSAAHKVRLRIVSATNRDLAARVEAGSFRPDVYYRLRGLEFRVPPLRERPEDLPGLLLSFTRRAAAKYGKRVLGVSRGALSRLLAHPWPGNVRELERATERAVLLSPDGGTLESRHFAAAETLPETVAAKETPAAETPPPRTLQEQVDAVERRALLEALAAAGGNKTRAAETLGITRNGLAIKMKRLGIRFGEP